MPEPQTILSAPPTITAPAAGAQPPFNPLPVAPLNLYEQIFAKANPEKVAALAKPDVPAPVTPPPTPDAAKPAVAAVVAPMPSPPPEPAKFTPNSAKEAIPSAKSESAELDPDIEKWRPPRSKDDWKTFKAEAKKREQNLQAKLAEIEQKLGGQDITALETVIKERDSLRQKLHEVNLSADPAFTKEFAQKESALKSVAKRAAGEMAPQIEVLLQAPPSEWRDKMLDDLGLTPGREAQVASALFSLDTLRADRDAKLADAPNISAQLNAQRQMHTKQQQDALLQNFEDRAGEWQKQMPFLTEKPDFKDRAKKYFSGSIGVEDAMDASFAAAAYPIVLESHLAVTQENEALKAELAKYKAGVPNPGGGSGPTPPANPQDDTHAQIAQGKTTLGDVIGKSLRQQGYITR